MKEVILLLATFLLQISFANCQNKPDEFPVLKGAYLGQKPPGDTAQPFLPEIFKNVHSAPAFSPDGKQVYWRCMDYKPLQFMEEVRGRWTKPRSVAFSTSFYRQDAPFITPDGNKLFFISTKPQKWYHFKSGEGIWYIQKQGADWSSPILASDFYTHWSFSVSNRGNLFIGGSEDSEHDIWLIYKLEYRDGKYLKPVKLSRPINLIEDPVVYGQVSPFIAPDESYLIFSRKINAKDLDLFISFQKEEGTWTEAINLGDKINSKGVDLCPMVTHDGKYLFYIRHDCVMWVAADFIEKLKPKE